MTDSDQDSGLLEKDFHCSCCFELMVDPTTLNCGHSFCRICLARWWNSSHKTTCPECRQSWSGFPKTNIILRKTIKRMFPDILTTRIEAVECEPKYETIINKFEAFGKKRNNKKQNGNQGQPVRRWVVIAKSIAMVTAIIGILMFLYDLFGFIFSWDQPLVHKPLEAWSPKDVSAWVSGLGPWSREINAQKFQDMQVSGKILKALTDDALEDLMEIKKPYLRESLLNEIQHVKLLGFKAPTELWEYKALFPTRCMFLLWGFREYPRATIIYSMIFLHKEVFLPLLMSAVDIKTQKLAEWEDEWYEEAALSAPIDVLKYLARVMVLPYYLIAVFAFQWVYVNPWTVGILLMFCTLKTLTEMLQSRWLLLGGWKHLPNIILKSTKSVLVNGSFYFLLWNILPSFITDIIFYWLMFTAPLYAWNSLSESFHSTRLDIGPVENTPLELTKSLMLWIWQKITRGLENNT